MAWVIQDEQVGEKRVRSAHCALMKPQKVMFCVAAGYRMTWIILCGESSPAVVGLNQL